jgi:hypothetical protein
MKINDIVLDSTTKDYVRITNGIPIKDAVGKETRDLEPTEGLVLRHVLGDGLFWAYISIAGYRLHETRVTLGEWDAEMAKTQGGV